MAEPFDQQDDEQVTAAREDRARQLAELEVEDLKWLMGHVQGRRFVWRLLSETGIFRNPYSSSATDTAFRCGQINSSQKLFADIQEHCLDRFVLMQKEQRNVRRSNGDGR